MREREGGGRKAARGWSALVVAAIVEVAASSASPPCPA